jgi:hypothetical protein
MTQPTTMTEAIARATMSEAIARVGVEVEAPALPVFYVEDEAGLLDAFGVQGVETPSSRIVKIADSSTVVCPMHKTRLLPEVCRSCSLLAGEVA